jgi:hypothetical protein
MTPAAGSTRFRASATCLSWIPPQAVEGAFKLPFSLGIAHYDAPPPRSAPDVDGLLAADAIRFANQIHAWVDVTDGQITGYGMEGGGRLSNTTVRLASRRFTFAGVALPDLTAPPDVHPDRVRFAPQPAAIPGRGSPGTSRIRPTYAWPHHSPGPPSPSPYGPTGRLRPNSPRPARSPVITCTTARGN